MSTKRIRALFEAELINFCAQNNLTASFDNKVFEPPMGSPYIRSHIIPAPTLDNSLGGDIITYLGVFQVNVYINEDEGSWDSDDIIEGLQERFQLNKIFTDAQEFSVQVISPMTTPEGRDDGGKWVVPCYFNYRADTNTTLTKRI